MFVEIKDRNIDTEALRMLLNICEVGVDYQTTDLILRCVEAHKKSKGKLTLLDGSKLLSDWRKTWQQYSERDKSEDVITESLTDAQVEVVKNSVGYLKLMLQAKITLHKRNEDVQYRLTDEELLNTETKLSEYTELVNKINNGEEITIKKKF